MDSPQSVVSPFKSSVVSGTDKQTSSFNNLSKEVKSFIGYLEAYVHQARDIQNICIYHKQDVYAKLYLTNAPESSVSTKTINGGGRNPVFNDTVRLDVQTVEASLKCELYMMSRVKNYLEDQLLGFALVPLSEIVLQNGKKLEREFSLSSSDMFHSPAGFVEMSLSYTGASPEVMTISPLVEDEIVKDAESLPSEMDKLEFPDPKVVNENEMMVSEYFGIPCPDTSNSLVISDADDQIRSEMGVRFVECYSDNSTNHDSPPSSLSSNGVSCPSSNGASKTSNLEHTEEETSKPSQELKSTGEAVLEPVLAVNIEPEHKVVQQDIVDMYMKSMQQFTESLAKMKLPLDIDSPTKSEHSSSDQNMQESKNSGSRVFYGSRAFF